MKAADKRPTLFWSREKIQLAVIAGIFSVVGTAIGLYKPNSKVNEPAPIVIHNENRQVPPSPAPPLSAPVERKITLEQFSLNTAISPFRLCKKRFYNCGVSYDMDSKLEHWAPLDENDPFDGAETAPIFNVVVNNGMDHPIALTKIEVVQYKGHLYSEGEGEDSTAGKVLKSIHRYVIRLEDPDGDIYPYRQVVSTTQPISIDPGQPGLFQIGFQQSGDVMMVYEMKLILHFGPNESISTDRFILTF